MLAEKKNAKFEKKYTKAVWVKSFGATNHGEREKKKKKERQRKRERKTNA